MSFDLRLPDSLARRIPDVEVPDPRECPPIRWGILGAGGIAGTFARATAEGTGCEVTVVGSRSLDRAQEFAAREGVPAAVGSYEDLLARDDVDAIYVATPHSEHHRHARAAIDAGKPVLVEKAFTRSGAEAREVLDAAQRAGLFAMEAMWSRFLPHLVVTRALAASGALGDLVEVHADHGQRLTHVDRLVRPELAGGALLDLGVYPLSFVHSLLGVPDAITSSGWLLDSGVDATSASVLAYPRTIATATTTLLARTPTTAMVGGTAGSIAIDPGFFTPVGLTVRLDDEPAVEWRAPVTGGGFEFQIAEAARCIAAGARESAVMPWRATLEVMDLMDEVRRQLGVIYPGEAGEVRGGGPR